LYKVAVLEQVHLAQRILLASLGSGICIFLWSKNAAEMACRRMLLQAWLAKMPAPEASPCPAPGPGHQQWLFGQRTSSCGANHGTTPQWEQELQLHYCILAHRSFLEVVVVVVVNQGRVRSNLPVPIHGFLAQQALLPCDLYLYRHIRKQLAATKKNKI
jgi:hypothetical protein